MSRLLSPIGPTAFVGAFAPDPLAPDVRQVYKQCVEDYGLRILKFELTEPTGLTGLHPDLRLGRARTRVDL